MILIRSYNLFYILSIQHPTWKVLVYGHPGMRPIGSLVLYKSLLVKGHPGVKPPGSLLLGRPDLKPKGHTQSYTVCPRNGYPICTASSSTEWADIPRTHGKSMLISGRPGIKPKGSLLLHKSVLIYGHPGMKPKGSLLLHKNLLIYGHPGMKPKGSLLLHESVIIYGRPGVKP